MRVVILLAVTAAHLTQALANPNAIYRCGHEFMNDAAVARARGCSLVDGGAAVTVTGTRVQARSLATNTQPNATPKATVRADNADQRARDRDALSILQAELGKAEALLAERQRELVEPNRSASRRVDVQSSIGRHLSDIASLKREISRLPAHSTLQTK